MTAITQDDVDVAWALLVWEYGRKRRLLDSEEERVITIDREKCRDLKAVGEEHGLEPNPDVVIPILAGLFQKVQDDGPVSTEATARARDFVRQVHRCAGVFG